MRYTLHSPGENFSLCTKYKCQARFSLNKNPLPLYILLQFHLTSAAQHRPPRYPLYEPYKRRLSASFVMDSTESKGSGISLPIREHPQIEPPIDSRPEIAAIPSRVNCHVPLLVTNSNIPEAGRGIITLQDISAGDMIFTIDRPLFSIVSILSPLFLPCGSYPWLYLDTMMRDSADKYANTSLAGPRSSVVRSATAALHPEYAGMQHTMFSPSLDHTIF